MQWVVNDGGRAAAGFQGSTRDCVVRAIAIAAQRPYQEVYDGIAQAALCERSSKRRRGKKSSPRTGVFKPTFRKYLEGRGWVFVPTMTIGSGCTVHLRSDELPSGRLIVSVSRHVCAVIDGVLHDTYDCTRAGTRCVYGYFHRP